MPIFRHRQLIGRFSWPWNKVVNSPSGHLTAAARRPFGHRPMSSRCPAGVLAAIPRSPLGVLWSAANVFQPISGQHSTPSITVTADKIYYPAVIQGWSSGDLADAGRGPCGHRWDASRGPCGHCWDAGQRPRGDLLAACGFFSANYTPNSHGPPSGGRADTAGTPSD